LGHQISACATLADTYYAVVVAFDGQGHFGQYLVDAVVVPTGELEYADLAVTNVVAPASASSGETVHLEWTVGNFGTGSTYIDRWFDRIVLSANDRYGDADDIELAVVQHLGALDVDQDTEYTGQADVQLPVGLTGDYWILVETDDDNRVFEYIFEGNNIRRSDSQVAIALTPYADLETSNLSAPTEADAGEAINVAWSVSNNGTGVTGDGTPGGDVNQWIDRIVFSRNIVYGDHDDVTIVDVPHVGVLSPDDPPYDGTWTGELPANLSGEYYVFVASDAADVVYEHSDTQPNVVRSDQTIAVRQWVIDPGTLTQNTVWSGLMKVLGQVTVPADVTLTIEPGSIVKFVDGSGQLDILGSLEARGTVGAPVVFTSWQDDTAGGDSNDDGDATSPAAGDWPGLRFSGSSASGVLEHVEIRHADRAIHAAAGGATISLRNSIVRGNNRGIDASARFVEVSLENCLIVDNQQTAVHVADDSQATVRNCTIVGNAFQGSGSSGSAIYIGAGVMTLESNIVAFNNGGIYHSGAAPALTIRNSDFHNPAGSEVHNLDPQILQQNGNSTRDPLFVDVAAGNYELDAGSAAIDSARAINAPAIDLLGRPRYDDPGVANIGFGHPAFVDMGAFERQEATGALDLAVTHVSNPDPADVQPGDTFTFEWTVENTCEQELQGGWVDRLYLSADRHLSPGSDHLLAEIVHEDSLAVHAIYTKSWTGQVPSGVVGPHYVLVHTNAGPAFRESTLVNNVLASGQALAANVPLLTLDAHQTGQVQQGEWVFFQFDADPGRTVRFLLDSAVSTGSVQLHLRRGVPPTVSTYDAVGAVFKQPDQEVRLIDPIDATYYAGVYGHWLPAGATDFTLTAELTDLSIREVTPNRVGNAGNATVKITGDSFTRASQVSLLAADGTFIEADEYYDDPTTLFATFDLAAAGAAAEVYDLKVTNPGSQSYTSEDAFTVLAGGTLELQARLVAPSLTRPGRTVRVEIEYTNTGSVDMVSPLFSVESTTQLNWRFPQSSIPGGDAWRESGRVTVLGLSSDGPPTILRPGVSSTFTLEARTPSSQGQAQLSLSVLGGPGQAGLTDAIDWADMEEDVRPADIDTDAWEPFFERLSVQTGSTWGDFLVMLRDNANHLDELGQRVYDADELFGFEFVQAASLGAPVYLARQLDASAPAPKLPLSFERSFLPTPLYRNRLGALGRGWTHSYEITLEQRSDGTVVVNGPQGLDSTFRPDGNGGFEPGVGDDGRLTTLPGGEFLLVGRDGVEIRFRSDGRFDWIRDPNGNRVIASYDAQGTLTALVHSSGDRFLLEHDATGRLVRLTDHANRVTVFAYDASGEHLLSVTRPDGKITSYTYITGEGLLRDHNLTSISQPGGPVQSFSYDDLGRLSEQYIAAAEESVEYSYSTGGDAPRTAEPE